ncbi:MAG: UDP-N-acetylmuramoyl-L-alanyl-D-glutamate--2,6-diaminopimelate ligase [Candidatus Brocadiia bacterium]
MLLGDLIANLEIVSSPARRDVAISGLTSDSRAVRPGWAFFAIPGTKIDGKKFVPEAESKGAACIIAEAAIDGARLPVVVVKDARKASWQAAAEFYRHPERSLRVIGVTGTNGKTTSTYILASIIKAAGGSAGVLGTIRNVAGGVEHKSRLTTPDPIQLYELLAGMRDAGDGWAVMEVSSHSLDQDRIGGLQFDGAIFTNLTRDHLDYHKTMDNYAQAKAKLFDRVKSEGVCAVNFSDAWGEYMARRARGQVIPYGLDLKGPVQLDDVILGPDGSRLALLYGGRRMEIATEMVGRFNAFNILGVAAMAYGLGFQRADVRRGVEAMKPVQGRLDRVSLVQPRVYVDYAHTDDALSHALASLRELKPRKLILVFGCGGDRDTGKRPIMGGVAEKFADRIYVTSDNPRSESPMAIIDAVLSGISDKTKVIVLEDRAEAIKAAIAEAHPDDYVLLAGKGHEDYQVFADRTVHFDDKEIALDALHERSTTDGTL